MPLIYSIYLQDHFRLFQEISFGPPGTQLFKAVFYKDTFRFLAFRQRQRFFKLSWTYARFAWVRCGILIAATIAATYSLHVFSIEFSLSTVNVDQDAQLRTHCCLRTKYLAFSPDQTSPAMTNRRGSVVLPKQVSNVKIS